jgi:hypothetical protein
MSDRDIARQLADWLAYMRKAHEVSIANQDPAIRDHIAKLAQWEKLVREIAEALE